MDSGMSLSDIAAVTRGANDENGWGSGWFLIVVLFLFMFGFGGNGWNRQGEFGQYATAASQQEILFGQQFGQLNDRLTNIGNGICNLGYEMQGGIGQLGKEVALAQNGTNMAIMQTGNDIQRQMADCCCTTQRGLDAINANIDAKFAARRDVRCRALSPRLHLQRWQLPVLWLRLRKRQHLTPYSARQAGRQQLLRFLIF